MARRTRSRHRRSRGKRKTAHRSRACRSRRSRTWRARASKSVRCKRSRRRARRSSHGKTRRGHRRTHHARRGRRNPGSLQRRLRDGTVIQLFDEGAHGRLMVHHPDGTLDDSRLAFDRALSRFRQFKSGKRYGRRSSRSAWRELAMDNPRRRRGRGRTRRNCGRRNPAQFPAPFASALNPPIARRDAAAMLRVLRKHGYGRSRRRGRR